MSIWSENIVFLRSKRKMTQSDLAQQLSVSRSAVGAYEESRCNPPIEIIVKMSDLFGVTIDSLLRINLRIYFLKNGTTGN